jgi:Flp pilus assembly protein TadG
MMSTRGTTVAPDGAPAAHGRARLRKHRQRGSEMLEFTLVLLPVLAFLTVTLDIAWAVYSRATLQYAVAQGVRYAVTCQTMTGLKQVDSIKATVQNNAFGRLGSAHTGDAWDSIQVHFFLPDGTDVSKVAGGNTAQNGVYPLVQVSVESFSLKTFMPTIKMPGLGTLSPITMAARAWDRMEAPPSTGAPAMY